MKRDIYQQLLAWKNSARRKPLLLKGARQTGKTYILQQFGNAVGGTANTTVQYLNTQLGQSGLAGWTPAIIALSVGMLFLGVFVARSGRKV